MPSPEGRCRPPQRSDPQAATNPDFTQRRGSPWNRLLHGAGTRTNDNTVGPMLRQGSIILTRACRWCAATHGRPDWLRPNGSHVRHRLRKFGVLACAAEELNGIGATNNSGECRMSAWSLVRRHMLLSRPDLAAVPTPRAPHRPRMPLPGGRCEPRQRGDPRVTTNPVCTRRRGSLWNRLLRGVGAQANVNTVGPMLRQGSINLNAWMPLVRHHPRPAGRGWERTEISRSVSIAEVGRLALPRS